MQHKSCYIHVIYIRSNAEATAMLNEIILGRIMISIANQNVNPNFASAIHPEMLLLTACLETEDSCWEQRLRAGMYFPLYYENKTNSSLFSHPYSGITVSTNATSVQPGCNGICYFTMSKYTKEYH